MRRRWWLAGVAAVLLAGAVALDRAEPVLRCALAPVACGLTQAAPGVFVDAAASAVTRADLVRRVAEADAVVAAHLGPRMREGRLMLCVTEACHDRLGGTGARAVAYGSRIVRYSPRGLTDAILAHEIAHLRIAELAGDVTVLTGRLPAWANEGLAVLVSDDPRYIAAGDPCATPPDGSLPAGTAAWIAAAGTDRPIYAMSACAMSRWLDDIGGWQAAEAALARGDWPR